MVGKRSKTDNGPHVSILTRSNQSVNLSVSERMLYDLTCVLGCGVFCSALFFFARRRGIVGASSQVFGLASLATAALVPKEGFATLSRLPGARLLLR